MSPLQGLKLKHMALYYHNVAAMRLKHEKQIESPALSGRHYGRQ